MCILSTETNEHVAKALVHYCNTIGYCYCFFQPSKFTDDLGLPPGTSLVCLTDQIPTNHILGNLGVKVCGFVELRFSYSGFQTTITNNKTGYTYKVQLITVRSTV